MSYGAAAMAAAAAIGAGLNANQQSKANEANAGIAKEQMIFQANMSNTAHQREVKDLRAAGLNPILSAGGSGASTPGGASATMVAPDIGSSAKAASDAYNQISRLDADTKNTMADTQLKSMQNTLAAEQAASTAKDVELKDIEKSYKGATMAKDLERKGVDVDGGKIANQFARQTFSDRASATKSSSIYESDRAKYSHVPDKFYESMGYGPNSAKPGAQDRSTSRKVMDYFHDLAGVGIRRLGGTK